MRRGEMLGSGSDADYENRWDAEETGLGAQAEQDPGAVIEQVVSEQLSLRRSCGSKFIRTSVRKPSSRSVWRLSNGLMRRVICVKTTRNWPLRWVLILKRWMVR